MSNGKLVRLPSIRSHAADEAKAARTDTERRKRLFDWALGVLQRLGLDKSVAAARTIEELRSIALDANSAEVILAIRDALHPASGRRRHDHFRGFNEGGPKRILQNQLNALKKDREDALHRRGRRRPDQDWSEQLILDRDGKVVPNPSNLILILRESPKWRGVLRYDEFSARVVMRKSPPWGEDVSDALWTDHHESLTRVWFESQKIKAPIGDIGRAVQAAARQNPFHAVRDYLATLTWDGVPRLETFLQDYFGVERTG